MSEELEKKKLYYELMLEGIRIKFSTLIHVSTLAAALLVIGSYDEGLFPSNNLTKFIIFLLLILMVSCIHILLSEADKLTERAAQELGKPYSTFPFSRSIRYILTGFENGKKSDKLFFERYNSQFPYLALCILWLVVIVLIILIWNPSILFYVNCLSNETNPILDSFRSCLFL